MLFFSLFFGTESCIGRFQFCPANPHQILVYESFKKLAIMPRRKNKLKIKEGSTPGAKALTSIVDNDDPYCYNPKTTYKQLSKHYVSELREMLRTLSLQMTGKKEQLIMRLLAHQSSTRDGSPASCGEQGTSSNSSTPPLPKKNIVLVSSVLPGEKQTN